MVRFLMVKKEKLISGCERETFYTIDKEVRELEMALMAGGSSESEYEVHAIIGCEIIDR